MSTEVDKRRRGPLSPSPTGASCRAGGNRVSRAPRGSQALHLGGGTGAAWREKQMGRRVDRHGAGLHRTPGRSRASPLTSAQGRAPRRGHDDLRHSGSILRFRGRSFFNPPLCRATRLDPVGLSDLHPTLPALVHSARLVSRLSFHPPRSPSSNSRTYPPQILGRPSSITLSPMFPPCRSPASILKHLVRLPHTRPYLTLPLSQPAPQYGPSPILHQTQLPSLVVTQPPRPCRFPRQPDALPAPVAADPTRP